MGTGTSMPRVALIGGTGLGELPPDWHVERRTVGTPYRDAVVLEARRGDDELILLPRHGERHHLLPHQVNYHANIAALRELGIDRVFATNAVGALRTDLAPGTLLVLDDFIDATRHRAVSLYDHPACASTTVQHADLSVPYCPALRDALLSAAAGMGLSVQPSGTYVCVDGPRYESPAEVRLFGAWGGDVVGMTGIPEAVFAREAGICYAGIAIVTNLGAGLSSEPLRHGLVSERMRSLAEQMRTLVLAATDLLPSERACPCGGA